MGGIIQETVLLSEISYIGIEFMAQMINYVPQKILWNAINYPCLNFI